MTKFYKTFIFIASICFSANLFALSLEEKRSEILERQKNLNTNDLSEKNTSLKKLYKRLNLLYKSSTDELITSADEALFSDRQDQIITLRKEIEDIENAWKSSQEDEYNTGSDDFGIWELGEIDISKLVVEYGSCESLYVIPADISKMKLNLHCLLSIPKESWPRMIDLILTHNSIGVKKINPFVKQLFLLKEDYTNVDTITADLDHLKYLEDTSRIIFVYTPPIESIKTSFYFLDKFKNSKSTFVYQVGSKIAIVGLARDVNKLITLAENVWDKNDKRVSKIITPQKMSPDDAVKLLKSYFGGLTDHTRPMISTKGGNNLSAFALKGENSVVLIGSKEVVECGETLIKQTEGQINDPSELSLYWHTCSHTKPSELAEILDKVYQSLIAVDIAKATTTTSSAYPMSPHSPHYSYNQPPPQPKPQPPVITDTTSSEHFFPFPATGSLLMVVRKDTLPKIKEVLKKLDSPKKMVEIEVLLCERVVGNTTKSGINLLKLGDTASNTNDTGFSYDTTGKTKGIMAFLFNSKKNTLRDIPAVDLSFNFLLSQEDVIVSASPSTTTLNQVPTTLAITDQISIHTGTSSQYGTQSYDREEIGITITLTPTVHDPETDDPYATAFITLENDIRFETINSNTNDRPSVHKRHITNTVRIPDGQTVIIGGLRSNSVEESSQKIPFLGEIPGFAKIFGSSSMVSSNREMFIFLKPKVINDPTTDLLRSRENRLKKRPGDSELMLEKLNESMLNEQTARYKQSLDLFISSGNKHAHTLRP